MSWSSLCPIRPARSAAAAEILAAGEAIDEGKLIAASFSDVYGVRIPLHVLFDSKDLFSSLSTQRRSVDQNVPPDVSAMR